MLSLVDVLKIIDGNEPIKVFDINKNITYDPRIEVMPKEWIEYTVKYIHSVIDIYNESYIVIGVEEVNNA